MILVLSLVLFVALATPFALPLEHVRPATAATFWFLSLVLRAGISGFVAVALLGHWCWHALPFVSFQGGAGHELFHAALVAPVLLIALSAASVCRGLLGAMRRVRDMLARSAVGDGPGGSVVVGGSQVVVAATGLRDPRVIVSAGALTAMDDEELAASLDHERGHIARGHGWALTIAEICRGAARFIPGTQRAFDELLFHLERDADLWALRRQHDPAALASAICKAAGSRTPPAPTLALSGSDAFTRRVEELLDGSPAIRLGIDRIVRLLAVVIAVATIAALTTLPAAASEGVRQVGLAGHVHHCSQR